MDDPDLPLLEKMAQGDSAAAVALMDRHADRLMAVAWRMLGERELAEDLVQETLIKAMKQAASWETGKAQFSTWMHRVLVNLCYDHLRRASTKREISGLETMPEVVDGAMAADDQMQANAMSRAVQQALNAISPRQKQAIILCHYEELSNAEAAEILDLTVEAVESLLARGRRSLRAQLEKLGFGATEYV